MSEFIIVPGIPSSSTYDLSTADGVLVSAVGSLSVDGDSGAGANEPVGFVQIMNNPMESALTTTRNSYGTYGFSGQFGSVTVQSDATAPLSPPLYYRHRDPANTNAGGSAIWRYMMHDQFPANTGNCYVRCRTRLNANYRIGPNYTMTKWLFPHKGGTLNNFMGLYEVSAGVIGIVLGTQNSGQEQQFNPSVGMVPFGQWFDLELLFLANTPGTTNGVFRVWVDGVLKLNLTNVLYFASGNSPSYTELWCDYVWSIGTGNTPSNPTNDLDLDHCYISVS